MGSKVEDRIEVRTTRENKDLIERAAALHGLTVTDFVVSNMVRAAREALQEQMVIELSNRDRDLFLQVLDADLPDNPSLLKALRANRDHT